MNIEIGQVYEWRSVKDTQIWKRFMVIARDYPSGEEGSWIVRLVAASSYHEADENGPDTFMGRLDCYSEGLFTSQEGWTTVTRVK
jgi:hypothetical protein